MIAKHTTWERHTIDHSLSGAEGVRLADINNDGLLDITTGWEENFGKDSEGLGAILCDNPHLD